MRRATTAVTLLGALLVLAGTVGIGGVVVFKRFRAAQEQVRQERLGTMATTLTELHTVLAGATSPERQRYLESEIGRWPITGPGFLVDPDFVPIDDTRFLVGIKAGRVFRGTPADTAGIRPGDAILSLNGKLMIRGIGEPRITTVEEAARQALELVHEAGHLLDGGGVVRVVTDRNTATVELRQVLFGTEIAHVLNGSGTAWVREMTAARERLAQLHVRLQSAEGNEQELSALTSELADIYNRLRPYQNAMAGALEGSTIREPELPPASEPLH